MTVGIGNRGRSLGVFLGDNYRRMTSDVLMLCQTSKQSYNEKDRERLKRGDRETAQLQTRVGIYICN